MIALINLGKQDSICSFFAGAEWQLLGSLPGKDLRVAVWLENIKAAYEKAEFHELSHSCDASLSLLDLCQV